MIVQSNELSQSLLKCFCHFSIRPTKRRFHEETDFNDRDSLSDALASLLNSHLLPSHPIPTESLPSSRCSAGGGLLHVHVVLVGTVITEDLTVLLQRFCTTAWTPQENSHSTSEKPTVGGWLFWGVGVHYFNEPVRRLPCRSSSNDPLELWGRYIITICPLSPGVCKYKTG